jgi:peptidoglycan/LPS O-acetylase OafA/YrhL
MPDAANRGDARLPELDALRGLAALIVLVHHAVQLFPRIDHPSIPGVGLLRYTLIHLTPLRIFEFGRPAVLFFFVLSGYVLTRALLKAGSPGLLAFAAQRTVRLGLPVVVSVLLSVGLWALFSDPALPAEWRERSLYTWLVPPDFGQVLSNALLLANNNTMRLNVVLWSLVHEWRLTVLLPLVLLLRGRAMLFAALALAATWIGVMGGAGEDHAVLGDHFHSGIAATLYFTAGIGTGVALALRFGLEMPVLGREARLAAVIACVALFGMASDIAVYAASALLIVLARQPWPLRAWLRTGPMALLGRLSFSLYLVHVPILVACMHALHDVASPLFIAVLGSVLATVAAAAMHVAAEEPARRMARVLERRLARPGWRQATPERRLPVRAPDWAPEGGMPAVPR